MFDMLWLTTSTRPCLFLSFCAAPAYRMYPLRSASGERRHSSSRKGDRDRDRDRDRHGSRRGDRRDRDRDRDRRSSRRSRSRDRKDRESGRYGPSLDLGDFDDGFGVFVVNSVAVFLVGMG